jgi:predicted phosphoadenosine phosphosulfate sulfurtransferase
MSKQSLGKNVFEAARERIHLVFDDFERVYVAFSGGKDSTVMLHLVMDEAIKRERKVGVVFIDLEGQYKVTIDHIAQCYKMYEKYVEKFWVCLPIHLRNGVSVYETHWLCWDPEKKVAWIREPPEGAITDLKAFSFAKKGMEFEEFVPQFGEWYAQGKDCCGFVGIRSDESLNRFRTIASEVKMTWKGRQWMTKVAGQVHAYSAFPIYDWKVDDIWIYHAKNKDKPYNGLYTLMHKAGLTLSQMRICQPYGDDQRKGLWLFHIIEPETWARVVARVNGANAGALYVQESGNIMGYRKISKPSGHTWESFAKLLLSSMPKRTQEHYENKIILFVKWWKDRGYGKIPEEASLDEETHRKVPSWRRVCKMLLRNDYWAKGLSFTQHKSNAYKAYLELMRRRKKLKEYQVL